MQQKTCHIYGLFFFLTLPHAEYATKMDFRFMLPLYLYVTHCMFFFVIQKYVYNNKMSLEKIMYNEFILLLVHIFLNNIILLARAASLSFCSYIL